LAGKGRIQRVYYMRYIALKQELCNNIKELNNDDFFLLEGKLVFKNASTAVLKKKINLKIYGNDFNTKDGSCIRDYIHVSDLSDIHIKILEKIEKLKKSIVLNCGYGKGISVKQVVNEFIKIVNKKANIVVLKRRPEDIVSSTANNTKLRNFIKWRPKYNNLNLIVKTCLDWERKI